MIFFYFEICYVKKNQILSKEDTNQFLFFFFKFRSASNEDANQFLIWEKFRFACNEDADLFLI